MDPVMNAKCNTLQRRRTHVHAHTSFLPAKARVQVPVRVLLYMQQFALEVKGTPEKKRKNNLIDVVRPETFFAHR